MEGAMEKLLRAMAERKASDLFLSPGAAIHLRINGVMMPLVKEPLDADAVRVYLGEILTERQWRDFLEQRELNCGYSLRGVGSFRVNVFQQRGSPSAVIRHIPSDVPSFETLRLPPVLADLVLEKRGLILIVGSTGSGKSTTLASMIDFRNRAKSGHILTFEDPIEFAFTNRRSIVNQRQIGTDTDSLAIGLRNAMRQAPDLILIGEIRDMATMSAAMAYAQSGHLVLSTLHANNANNALNRIVSFYPPENRRVLLADLAATMKAIASQRLVRTLDGARVPAVELLLNTRHVQELIEQGRLSEIKEAMEQSLAPGSQTFEQALLALIRSRTVGREDALANADSPTNLLWLLDNSEATSGAPVPSPKATAPQPRDGERDAPTSFSEFNLDV